LLLIQWYFSTDLSTGTTAYWMKVTLSRTPKQRYELILLGIAEPIIIPRINNISIAHSTDLMVITTNVNAP